MFSTLNKPRRIAELMLKTKGWLYKSWGYRLTRVLIASSIFYSIPWQFHICCENFIYINTCICINIIYKYYISYILYIRSIYIYKYWNITYVTTYISFHMLSPGKNSIHPTVTANAAVFSAPCPRRVENVATFDRWRLCKNRRPRRWKRHVFPIHTLRSK